MDYPIYLGTILLEKNRWKPERAPEIRVSDWLPRIAAAGFDGIELWEKHYTLAPPEEREAIRASAVPVAVFNTYARFGPASGPERAAAAEAVRTLGARGVKFNLGPESAGEGQVREARAWGINLPENVRLLCECHAGTLMEDPARAASVFAEWEDARFQAIVHPFIESPESLQRWFDALGPRITHAHVQVRGDEGRVERLDRSPDSVRDTLLLMRDNGFAGSFTLEFTQGTSAPDENPKTLFENALRDLELLRSLLP